MADVDQRSVYAEGKGRMPASATSDHEGAGSGSSFSSDLSTWLEHSAGLSGRELWKAMGACEGEYCESVGDLRLLFVLGSAKVKLLVVAYAMI